MWRRLRLMSGFLGGLLVVACVVVAGSLWIWQGAIDHRVEALRNERFRFSLMDMKATLEAGLRLGNATADLTETTTLVTQVRDRQPDILSIDVYDAQGDVLFSTDPSGRGLKLPPAWQPPCLNPNDTGWSGPDAQGGVQCVGLVNAFGQPAGGVLLRHRHATQTTAGLALPTDWPVLTATVLALMAAACWVAALATRPLHRQAHGLRTQLDNLAAAPAATGTATATPTGTQPAAPDPVTDALGPATAALHALQAHNRWLLQTDAEADQIDAQEAA